MFSQRLQRERREAAISASLITRLKEAVQSVLQPGAGGGISDVRGPMKGNLGAIVGHSDNTNNLCNVIEAILIHGLRDSLGERMSALLGADPDRMPVPNFWPVIMIISHRDLMEQVGDLSFITSEVGRSRAWVRLALNQGQICSYLSVLLQDNRTLKDYYRTTAVFRDPERADIILRVLQPISALTFNLATNAAVLNTWTQTPLILAGLWAPSVQSVVSDPVLAATDVASTVMDERTEGMNIPIVETPVSDQMFDMIFGGTPETSFISNMESRESKDPKVQDDDALRVEKEDKHNPPGSQQGGRDATEDKRDSAVKPTEGPGDQKGSQDHGKSPRVEVQSPLEESQKQHSRDHSFTNSTESRDYHRTYSTDSSMSRSVIEGAPEYDQLFLDITAVSPFPSVPGLSLSDVDPASSNSTPSRETSHESSHSDEAEKLNYEVLSQQIPSDTETERLIPLLTRLTTEEGLDAQQYQCQQCNSYIGMIYGKPRVCSYDSKYYCYECHEDEMCLIPARVVHNWDLGGHPVCKRNASWLSAVQHQPLINLRTVNPKLYCHIDDLAEMQMLRTQLLYVRAYLFTCKTGVGEDLRKLLWPREHLYEHVHLYSVSDLQLVATGQLVQKVRQAVTFGRDHVAQCHVCSARGFICELCDDNDVIYPFQLGSTHTCNECYGVYHGLCARGRKDCPRCIRRKARKSQEDS